MIKQRPLNIDDDYDHIIALVHRYPDQFVHVIDLPYRLCSWAFDCQDNAAAWFTESGELLAWAVLQAPFWVIDIFHSRTRYQETYQKVLLWAEERCWSLRGTQFGRPTWFIKVFEGQTILQAELEDAGFASQADVGEDSWSQMLFERDATLPGDEYHLPEGFSIRSLKGHNEVDAYVDLHQAVFESKSMTPQWRQRTLERPEYRADLDLVVEAPGGRLAGFCICWFDQHGPDGVPSGQFEPVGVHKDFRGLGLGKALLNEGIRRMKSIGTERIYVETDDYRNTALELYKSVGFQKKTSILIYRKDFPL